MLHYHRNTDTHLDTVVSSLVLQSRSPARTARSLSDYNRTFAAPVALFPSVSKPNCKLYFPTTQQVSLVTPLGGCSRQYRFRVLWFRDSLPPDDISLSYRTVRPDLLFRWYCATDWRWVETLPKLRISVMRQNEISLYPSQNCIPHFVLH